MKFAIYGKDICMPYLIRYAHQNRGGLGNGYKKDRYVLKRIEK